MDGNPLLFPFVLCVLFESDQVEHFPHPAPYPFAVPFLQFVRIEVRRCMGLDAVPKEQFVSGEQDFPDDVAVLPEVPSDRLDPDIVEAVKTVVPVIPDGTVPDVVEAEGDVPGRDYLIRPDMRNYMPDELQDRCLSAADRTGKQDALVGVDPELRAGLRVLDHIDAQPVYDIEVFLPDMEFLAEQPFALGIQISKYLHKIVVHFFPVEFPEGMDRAAFVYFRGVLHSFFDCWS